MPSIKLDVSSTSQALAVFGFYLTLVCLFTKPIKNKLYLPDSALLTVVGIVVGPLVANWISPWKWTSHDDESRNELTYQLTRIAIGIQVFFCGLDLPKAYVKQSWRSLCFMLGPIMIFTWLITSTLIWTIIPNLDFLEASVIGACIAPTDPVLANAIVKGHYAETNIPEYVRALLASESGANDGLGVPFIFLSIYLIKAHTDKSSTSQAVGEWIVNVIIYQIMLCVFLGIFLGYVARKVLMLANKAELIDHECFQLYAVGLPFFTLGVTGMIGVDDILVCFVAANSFNWDGYYVTEIRGLSGHTSFQDLVDSLLNSAVFIYIATIMPWSEFSNSSLGLTPARLSILALAIIVLKRLPMVALTFKIVPELRTWQDMGFVGWFGPIGVGAVYYSQVGLREVPEEQVALRTLIVPVVMFLVFFSIWVYACELFSSIDSSHGEIQVSKVGTKQLSIFPPTVGICIVSVPVIQLFTFLRNGKIARQNLPLYGGDSTPNLPT